MIENRASSPRWRMLALLSVAELLGMSLWFAANAVSSSLAQRWSLDSSQIGWLTSIVQLGFVAGTAVSAVLNVSDLFPARRLFMFSALFGAVANLGILMASSFSLILLARFATGFFLAGVYPPAMKMISTWFVRQRGLAIGAIVGALTIGKATPYLVHAFPNADSNVVIATASACAALAALLVGFLYRDGDSAFPSRPFSWGLVAKVIATERWRLATLSYLGHMFELYAFWTWIGVFISASFVANQGDLFPGTSYVSAATFAVISVGAAGCVLGGLFADRFGRERLVRISLFGSGLCCLLSAFLFAERPQVVLLFAIVWGFLVIADSAQFSALVTESVESHAVGTALTLQTSLGFLLTMLPMQLVPKISSAFGMRWGLFFLALGPAVGIAAIEKFRRTNNA